MILRVQKKNKESKTEVAETGQDTKERGGKCSDNGKVLSDDSPSSIAIWVGLVDDITEEHGKTGEVPQQGDTAHDGETHSEKGGWIMGIPKPRGVKEEMQTPTGGKVYREKEGDIEELLGRVQTGPNEGGKGDDATSTGSE